MRKPWVFVVITWVSYLLAPVSTMANGRYPSARYLLVGPGDRASIIVLQTTHGVALSTDGGQHWRWACEEAMGFNGLWDPTLAMVRDGTLIASLPDGLSISRPSYCRFDRPETVPRVQIVDLSADPNGDRVVAAMSSFDRPNGVFLSDDRGATWYPGWSRDEFFIETVDIAPGHPERLYVTGYLRGGVPVLFRSDDGGRTFREATRDFLGGYDAFIAAVDPIRPEVVYVRSNLTDGGTLLLRSEDSGSTFREIARTTSRMIGVAVAPGGATLWIAGTDARDGMQRSDDGGRHWRRLSDTFTPLCLRYQAGILFACANELTDGFSLACSTDGGDHFVPLFSFVDLPGPEACPVGTPVRDHCGPSWTMLTQALMRDGGEARPPRGSHPFDASTTDGGTDAVPQDQGSLNDAAQNERDRHLLDAGIDGARDADPGEPASRRAGGCHCSARTQARKTRTGACPSVIVLFLLFTPAIRRRESTRLTPSADHPAPAHRPVEIHDRTAFVGARTVLSARRAPVQHVAAVPVHALPPRNGLDHFGRRER